MLEIKQNYFSNSEDFLDEIEDRNNKIIKSKIKNILIKEIKRYSFNENYK